MSVLQQILLPERLIPVLSVKVNIFLKLHENPNVILIENLNQNDRNKRPPPSKAVQQEFLMAAEGMVFLRAFLVCFCLFEGRVYLKLGVLEIP